MEEVTVEEVAKKIMELVEHREIIFLRTIFVLISSFFIGIIIYTRYKTRWARMGTIRQLSEFLKTTAFEKTQFRREWEKTKRRLEKGWESEGKLAVIEADEMLGEVLKRAAYLGDNTEERLEEVPENTLPNKKELKEAHKLCADIIHDPDYKLSPAKARWAIEVYEEAFESLSAL